MNVLSSNGFKISVTPTYRAELSDPQSMKYLFSYEITIANESAKTFQLISRRWIIFDSCGDKREVSGPGVVGEQPVIQPLEEYTYSSWCPLTTDFGYMKGEYLMQDHLSEEYLKIQIPQFLLIATHKLN